MTSMYWADNSYLLALSPRAPRHGQEERCPYCDGYGYNPRRQDELSGPKAVRCDRCDGAGLQAKPGRTRK